MVLYQKKKRVKPFLDPDGKTLLYGSFRPVNGQSINNKGKRQIPETLRAAKALGDDICFCFLFFAVIFRGKCLVQGLSLSSFPNVVVGNLLFVVAVILESRSPGSVVRRTCSLAKLRDPRQKPSEMTVKMVKRWAIRYNPAFLY